MRSQNATFFNFRWGLVHCLTFHLTEPASFRVGGFFGFKWHCVATLISWTNLISDFVNLLTLGYIYRIFNDKAYIGYIHYINHHNKNWFRLFFKYAIKAFKQRKIQSVK